MLVEPAIGDAYGAAFEYAQPSPDRPNDLGRYYQHPPREIAPGCYTHDSQMSIAVAEALIEHGPAAPSQQYVEKFVTAFKRDPREGYASRFYDFLTSVRDADDFAARIEPKSTKSSAAMRSCPLGVLPVHDDLLVAAERHAGRLPLRTELPART
jgi:ADP-ribosyl-[dinitrogen reductase] hydrolase